MSKTRCTAIVASVAFVSLGSPAGQAQQTPPQSPNMTFFVTSAGPGKGGRPRRLCGSGSSVPDIGAGSGAVGKTWRAYPARKQVATPAVDARDRIGPAPGRISKARSSRRTSTIFMATTTSSACRCR